MSTPHQDAGSLWRAVLSELQLQMPRATFETWLKSTTAQVDGDTLTVIAGNPYAQDWLDNRLRNPIERTVAGLAGRPLTIVFAAKATEPINAGGLAGGRSLPQQPSDSADPTPSSPGPGEIAIELVEFDPTKRGFVMTANYVIRFWQPYLGVRPFALWQTLKSFAFQAGQDAWPSIQTLADIVADGNRHLITGRAARNGRQRQVGALEVLEEERIVWILRDGEGSRTRYRFRVLASLPLLAPVQVKRLPPNLRAAHEHFINQCAIDHQEWRQMTLPTLVSLSED
jgi:hypothetical protein